MPGLRRILRINGGAVKRQNLICSTFGRRNVGIDLPGVLVESGRCISLWVLAFRSGNWLRINFLRKKRAYFGQPRELVVGGSRKFFREGFPAALR
jgi:hypothetical protein